MLAYLNKAEVKSFYQERFAAHRVADEVMQGRGYENGRGCFVGCTLNDYDHSKFPEKLGWPVWLAKLADAIFESLPKAEAPEFGTLLLDAVPVGVNLQDAYFPIIQKLWDRAAALVAKDDKPLLDIIRVGPFIEQSHQAAKLDRLLSELCQSDYNLLEALKRLVEATNGMWQSSLFCAVHYMTDVENIDSHALAQGMRDDLLNEIRLMGQK